MFYYFITEIPCVNFTLLIGLGGFIVATKGPYVRIITLGGIWQLNSGCVGAINSHASRSIQSVVALTKGKAETSLKPLAS